MKIIFLGILMLSAPSATLSYPISMDIGTFAIDAYQSNGGGMLDLNYMFVAGENFFFTAKKIIPQYTQITSLPTHPMAKKNNAVTYTALNSTLSSMGEREYNDFLFYGGHGLSGNPPSMFLGFAPGYGQVFPNTLNLGVGYTRYFMAHSCNLFNCSQGPQACWNSAFKGLKAMLGYRSLMWDINISWDFFNEFWANWTVREKSLLNSHFDAVSYLFSRIKADPSPYGGPGIVTGFEPGCLSAPVPEFTLDHCRLSFKYVANDYVKANNGTGYYYSRIIGTPRY